MRILFNRATCFNFDNNVVKLQPYFGVFKKVYLGVLLIFIVYYQNIFRYSEVQKDQEDGVMSEVTIISADRRDSALFSCTASNEFGRDETNFQVVVQGTNTK